MPKSKWPSTGLARLHTAVFSIVTTLAVHAEEHPDILGSCQFDKDSNRWQCDDNGEVYTSDFDWLPARFLSESAKAELASQCLGQYVDPVAGQADAKLKVNETPLEIEADYSQVNDGNFATLQGNVRLSQADRSLSADEVTYDRLKDTATLSGGVTIRQQGMLVRGAGATISTVDQTGEFREGQFLLHDAHIRGSAKSIQQRGKGKIILQNGTITSCEPGSSAWSLEGQELGVDSEKKQGYGKNIRLKIGGVPVFYLPYISFPIGDERRSGVLFPSISSSDDGGLDVSVPYYFNLADNYDLTLAPRLITGRGAMLETEFRHLSRYFYTQLNTGFLGSDEGGNNIVIDDDGNQIDQTIGSDRWLFQLQQSGGNGRDWYSIIDFTRTSDENYFRDLGTSSFSVANTTYLNQTVEVGTSLKNWDLQARIEDFQTLLFNLDSPFVKLPELNATGTYKLGPFHTVLNNQITRFDNSNELTADGETIVTGDRFAGDYRISSQYLRPWVELRSELGYKQLAYRLRTDANDTILDDSVQLGAGQFLADAKLIFERNAGVYTQVLEPRGFYFFREFTDHDALFNATASGQGVNFDTTLRNFSYGQLYRDSRFSGSDRLDDANRITLGITNRWISNADGHETFNFSVGRIYHLRDRVIGLEQEIDDTEQSSEWASEFVYRWRNGSSFFGSVVLDSDNREVTRFASGYNYASPDNLSLFNISYSFLREDDELTNSERTNQLDTAFIAPVHKAWFVLGRANYDFENNQELETFAGVEFNSCCYRLRIIARRWLDSNIANLNNTQDVRFDRGIFFEIHLKGLGGSGAKVNSIIEDALPGYRRREDILNAP